MTPADKRHHFPSPPLRRWFSHDVRTQLSRVRALILTMLGQPRGFFTQYAYANHVQPVTEPYFEVEKLFAASPFPDFMAEIETHVDAFRGFGESPTDPVLGRGIFPALDGMAAYAAVRKFKPNRIIEIGSGDSTYFLARGVQDNQHGMITCIDPAPKREITALGVALKPRMLTSADAALAAALEENDILFIDSSHIMLPGMDVDIQFNRFFPRLQKGVIVHLHDIFLPDGYPTHWRLRNYTEQNALIGWLLGGYFELIWCGYYVVARRPDIISDGLREIAPMDVAGSLWLRRA